MPPRAPLRSPSTPSRRAPGGLWRLALVGALSLGVLTPVRAAAPAPAAAAAPGDAAAASEGPQGDAPQGDAPPPADDAREAAGEDDAAAEAAGPAEPGPEGPEDTEATADAEVEAPPPAPRKPPRVDGIYLGAVPYFPVTFARVRVLDTPGAFVGAGGSARIGEVVYPWLTLGLDIGGSVAYQGEQRVAQGALFVDAGFLPAPKIPLSIHVGFGVGGGAVRQQGVEGRQGFGGAAFRGSLRYDVFPLVERMARKRGGGFAVGPELGWIGLTPAAKGRPMSNTAFVGLFVGYYFGA